MKKLKQLATSALSHLPIELATPLTTHLPSSLIKPSSPSSTNFHIDPHTTHTFTLTNYSNRPCEKWTNGTMTMYIERKSGKDACLDEVSMEIKRDICEMFVRIYEKFVEIVGRRPRGDMYIEIPLDNRGAGGLACHGVCGISVGRGLFAGLVMRWKGGVRSVDQVYFYEMNRNFWFEEYNRAIDWCCDGDEKCWGWWTVGFNNAMSVIVPDLLGIEFYYFGQGRKTFEQGMLNDYRGYLKDKRWNFETGWQKSMMPWRPKQSINNLMSGFILDSYTKFGGRDWITGVYREILQVVPINSSNAGATCYQGARDNIYTIWSRAAHKDLRDFFKNTLRWKISDQAMRNVNV